MAKSNIGAVVLAVIESLEIFGESYTPKVTKVKPSQEARLLNVLGIDFGYEGFTVTRTDEGFRCTVERQSYRNNPRLAKSFMNTVADACRARYQDQMTVTRDGFVCVKL